MSGLSKLVSRIAVGVIRCYQYALSPWLGPRCRFTPSCSEYAIDAIRVYGSTRGGWLALKRIARCHPWARFGYDPVPREQTTHERKTVPE